MPVPTHFKFTVRGTFDSSPETWVTGCHFSRENGGGPDSGLGEVDEDGVTDAVDAFFGGSDFCSNAKVSDWRMYVIGTDGKMEGDGPLLHDYVAAGPHGSAGAWRYPPQVAMVVSLVADHRGPAKHGRMYLPAPAAALASGGRISTGDAADLAANVSTFLKAVSNKINVALLGSATAVNVSRGPVGSSEGTIQAVDHVLIGRALDTMRSRRRSLLEDYAVGAQIDW